MLSVSLTKFRNIHQNVFAIEQQLKKFRELLVGVISDRIVQLFVLLSIYFCTAVKLFMYLSLYCYPSTPLFISLLLPLYSVIHLSIASPLLRYFTQIERKSSRN